MINREMKPYQFFTLGEEDAYGQQQISKEPKGVIKMAVYLSSQSIQDNINYKDCQYVGLTHFYVDDSYIIKYGNVNLKVLYVNSAGKYKQVFMSEI